MKITLWVPAKLHIPIQLGRPGGVPNAQAQKPKLQQKPAEAPSWYHLGSFFVSTTPITELSWELQQISEKARAKRRSAPHPSKKEQDAADGLINPSSHFVAYPLETEGLTRAPVEAARSAGRLTTRIHRAAIRPARCVSRVAQTIKPSAVLDAILFVAGAAIVLANVAEPCLEGI
jgi:hypothetical protein